MSSMRHTLLSLKQVLRLLYAIDAKHVVHMMGHARGVCVKRAVGEQWPCKWKLQRCRESVLEYGRVIAECGRVHWTGVVVTEVIVGVESCRV